MELDNIGNSSNDTQAIKESKSFNAASRINSRSVVSHSKMKAHQSVDSSLSNTRTTTTSSSSSSSSSSSFLSNTYNIEILTHNYPNLVKYQNSSVFKTLKKLLKLKICMRIASLLVIAVLLTYTLIVSILNVANCPIDYRIPVYLLVFSALALTRILLLVGCPYDYSKFNIKKKLTICKLRNCGGTDIDMPRQRRVSHNPVVVDGKNFKLFKCCLKFLKSKKKIKLKRRRRRPTYIHRHEHHHHIRYLEKLIDVQSIRYCLAYLVQRSLDVFMVCWFFYGNYIVFNVKDNIVLVNSTWLNQTTTNTSTVYNSDYCDSVCYTVAFYQVIVIYVLILALFVVFLLHSIFRMIFTKNNFNKHQYHIHA